MCVVGLQDAASVLKSRKTIKLAVLTPLPAPFVLPTTFPRPRPPWRQGLCCMESGMVAGGLWGDTWATFPPQVQAAARSDPSDSSCRCPCTWPVLPVLTPSIAFCSGHGHFLRLLLSSSFRLCRRRAAVQQGRAGEEGGRRCVGGLLYRN